MKKQKISIVIPVFESAEALPELYQRIAKAFENREYDLEVICVDDASKDDSWQTLKELKKQNLLDLKLLRLRKNAGQHNAIVAGFSVADGDIVVTIDDDLQNPPEEIYKLLDSIIEGDHDMVIAEYPDKQHSAGRNISGEMVDKVLRTMFRLPKGFSLTSFRAVRREVVEQALEMNAVYPYVTAMLLNQTSDCANVLVKHDERKHGTSNYTLNRSLKLLANLILSYSNMPVLLVGILCSLGVLFSAGVGIWVLVQTIVSGTGVPGWASTLTIISILNSMMLFCMFVFTLYLSRISRLLLGGQAKYIIAEYEHQ